MQLIDKNGSVRKICRECRKVHAPKDCPRIESKIIAALALGAPYGERYSRIAAELGIPWRMVQQCVGRLMRQNRSRLG